MVNPEIIHSKNTGGTLESFPFRSYPTFVVAYALCPAVWVSSETETAYIAESGTLAFMYCETCKKQVLTSGSGTINAQQYQSAHATTQTHLRRIRLKLQPLTTVHSIGHVRKSHPQSKNDQSYRLLRRSTAVPKRLANIKIVYI